MKISHNIKGFIFAILLISIFLYGYRYYRYTQQDPDFCSSCHLVSESHVDWQKSSHNKVICQKCHEIGVLEQNLRFFGYITSGADPISLSHGRKKPWILCKDCHANTASQGAISPSKAYGHAKHVVTLKMECKQCHVLNRHNLPYYSGSCINCHKNKEVHGITIAEFSCINCHPFTRKHPVMTPPDKCTKCHLDMLQKNRKSKLSCHYCHKPHMTDKPSNSVCIECHKMEATIGQHGFHTKQGIECMYCHKPHTWSIGLSRKKILCSECHTYKDPRKFIYIF